MALRTPAIRLLFSLLLAASIAGCVPPASKDSPRAAEGRIRVVSDRLRFESVDDVRSLLAELDAASEFDRLGSPSACEQFETRTGFRSLRQTLEDQTTRELARGWDGKSPLEGDEFVTWEALRTVLNRHRQLQIGDEVLTLLDEETMVATPASNGVALRILTSHPSAARAFAVQAAGGQLGRILDRTTGRPPERRASGSPLVPTTEPNVEARAHTVLFDEGTRVLVGKLALERFFGTRLVFEARHFARSARTDEHFEPSAAGEIRVTLSFASDALAPSKAALEAVSLSHDARLGFSVDAPHLAELATFEARAGGGAAVFSLRIGDS